MYILPQCHLRLGRLGQTFDPDESSPFGIGMSASDDEGNDEYMHRLFGVESMALSEASTKMGRVHARLLCLTNSYEPLNNFQWQMEGDEGWAQRALWAHFAKRHTGVAIELDREQFIRDAKEQLEGKARYFMADVAYLDSSRMRSQPPHLDTATRRELGIEGALRYVMAHTFLFNFFQKSASWAYENEFRILALSECAHELYLPIANSIKSITLGKDFSEDLHPSLAWALKSSGLDIPVYGVGWSSMFASRFDIKLPAVGGAVDIPVRIDPNYAHEDGGCPDGGFAVPEWSGSIDRLATWRRLYVRQVLEQIADGIADFAGPGLQAAHVMARTHAQSPYASERLIQAGDPYAESLVFQVMRPGTDIGTMFCFSQAELRDEKALLVELAIGEDAGTVRHSTQIEDRLDDAVISEMRTKFIEIINDKLKSLTPVQEAPTA